MNKGKAAESLAEHMAETREPRADKLPLAVEDSVAAWYCSLARSDPINESNVFVNVIPLIPSFIQHPYIHTTGMTASWTSTSYFLVTSWHGKSTAYTTTMKVLYPNKPGIVITTSK